MSTPSEKWPTPPAATTRWGTPVAAQAVEGAGSHSPAADQPSGAIPQAGPASVGTATVPTRRAGPRKARLTISRVDPVSVMKFSFLMSFALGIVLLVATALVWVTVNNMGLFVTVNNTIKEIVGAEVTIDILQYVEFGRVMSVATLIGLANIVLLTLLGTLTALLYNLVSVLVGGITVSLSDE